MYVLRKSYDEMTDQETLVRVTTILERLVNEVSELSNKVDKLKDEEISKIRFMEKQITSLENERLPETIATHAEKIGRLESTLYWLLGVAFVEACGLITMIIFYFVTKP